MLQTYVLIRHHHHDQEFAALLHWGAHMDHARRQLRDFVAGLIADAAAGPRPRR